MNHNQDPPNNPSTLLTKPKTKTRPRKELVVQQQYELEPKMKQDVLERESRARVDLLESQKIAEDMRVLTMDTSSLDPMNAAIVKAQQARIRAKYPTRIAWVEVEGVPFKLWTNNTFTRIAEK
ncbi:hypothetical protein Tco_0362265 [Tanacetum coccineum]